MRKSGSWIGGDYSLRARDPTADDARARARALAATGDGRSYKYRG